MRRSEATRFAFRLALAFRDPFITRKMSAKRFAEWMAYEQTVGPFGELRDDWRTAQVVATIRNSHATKREDLVTVEDCLLKFVPPKPKQTWQEQQQIAFMIARIYNADGITE